MGQMLLKEELHAQYETSETFLKTIKELEMTVDDEKQEDGATCTDLVEAEEAKQNRLQQRAGDIWRRTPEKLRKALQHGRVSLMSSQGNQQRRRRRQAELCSCKLPESVSARLF